MQVNKNTENIGAQVADNTIEKLLEYVSNGVAMFERMEDGFVLSYCNRTLCTMLGYSPNTFRKKAKQDVFTCVRDADRQALEELYESCLKSGLPKEMIAGFTKSDRASMWLKVCVMSPDADGQKIVVTYTDVTNEINSKEELRFRADHDELTSVYNANAFYRHTKDMITADDSEYILVRLNIIKFKVINDIFGAKAADDVLVTMARHIEDTVTKRGGTYGRLTSDHFAVCIPSDNFYEQLLLDSIQSLKDCFPRYYNINIKAGVYRITSKDVSVAVMCDRAKLAMQSIKEDNTKVIAYYNDDIRKNLLREQRIENEMEWALETEQFEVWFQPIYSLSSMQPYSAEALVRWRHPTKGLVPPGMFIPIFEKNGFISKLDYYIFDHVCAYIKERRLQGLRQIPISVNVSRMSLFNETLADDIIALVKKYELSPELFKIEITETAYSNNPTIITNTVNKLRAYGFTILMDDFGSGYSSLNILKDLPIDVLKIDMNFMADLTSTDKAANILTSIVRMAKWLDMPCIAEGVETKSQVTFLKSIGCDNIQGFYFSKPLPREDFEAIIASNIDEIVSDKRSDTASQDVDAMLSSNETITKLMNGMFGGMGFYELEDDKLEAIRVNEGYYQIFGYTLSEFSKDAKNVLEKVYPDDKKVVLEACRKAIYTKKTVHHTVRRIGAGGKLIYLDAAVSSFGGTNEKALLCIAFNDITAHKTLEKKSGEKMRLLNVLSRRLLERTDIDVTIDEILKIVRKYFRAERASIYEFNEEEGMCYNLYEQCADGFNGHIAEHKAIPISFHRPWIDYIKNKRVVSIASIPNEPTLSGKDKAAMTKLGVKSVIAVPILTNRVMTGFINIDNPKDNFDQVDFLQSFSYYYSLEMMKYRMQQRTESYNKRMDAIMENMDGGVGLFTFDEKETYLSFATDKFREIIGAPQDYTGPFFDFVNSLDRDEFKRKSRMAMSVGETLSMQFRASAPTEDGRERWIAFSGTVVYNPETNEPMGIAVITDITDRIYAEQSKYSAALTSVYDRIYRVDMLHSEISLISEKNHDSDIIHQMLDVFSDSRQEKKRKWLAKICTDALSKGCSSSNFSFTDENGEHWYTCTAVKFTETVFLLCIMNTTSQYKANELERENERLLIKQHFHETSNIYVRQTGIVLLEYDFATRSIESTENYSRFALSNLDVATVNFSNGDFGETIHPDDCELVRDIILDNSTDSRVAEARLLEVDGGYVWCQLRKTMSFDRSGKPSYANYTILDIDERKKDEAKVKHASELLKNVVKSVGAGIAFVELSDNGEIVPIFRNSTYYTLLGYDRETYISKRLDLLDIVSKDERRRFKKSIMSVAYDGVTLSENITITGNDGKEKCLRCEFAPYISTDENDKSKRITAVITDITELVEQTQRLDAVINSLPGGVANYRVAGEKVTSEFFSNSLPEIWGYGDCPEEYKRLVEKDVMSLVYKRDYDRVYAAMTYLVKTGESIRLSFRVNCKVGYRWVTMSANKISDHADGSVSISCLYTVSSDRELMYRRMLDEASIGIYVCDEQTHATLYMNNTLRTQLNIDEETDVSKISCYDLLSGGNKKFADSYNYDSYQTRTIEHDKGIFYIRGRRIDWNGIPAIIEYISD